MPTNLKRNKNVVLFIGFIASDLCKTKSCKFFALEAILKNEGKLISLLTHFLQICFPFTGQSMTKSLNDNIFRVTGPLCGGFTGHRWIPLTKESDAKRWCFFCIWTIGWVNNLNADDFRRNHVHYDITLIRKIVPVPTKQPWRKSI